MWKADGELYNKRLTITKKQQPDRTFCASWHDGATGTEQQVHSTTSEVDSPMKLNLNLNKPLDLSTSLWEMEEIEEHVKWYQNQNVGKNGI